MYPDPLERPKYETKIYLQEGGTGRFGAASNRPDSNSGLMHCPDSLTRGMYVDSTPIALPRPPQTRAASFKRLYPK